jgi:hypothetical protein
LSVRPAGESGTSVAEMAVVVALLGVVLAVSLQSFNSFQSAAAGSDRRLRDLGEARTVMAVLTKDLRTAGTLCSISASDVTFLAFLNTGATAPPNEVRLYATGGSVFEATTPPDNPAAAVDCTTYNGTPVTRPLGQNVTGTGTLFGYLDGNGSVTASLNLVRSVAVTLTVSSAPAQGVAPTTLSSQVWLANVAAAA